MHKSLVILIILGLIFPVLYTKGTGLPKKQRNINNAEESLDFWDFNPHADGSSTTKTEQISANKKSTMNELEKILKGVEATLSKAGRTTIPNDRFLLEELAVETRIYISAEEEDILVGENTETVFLSEEELLVSSDNNEGNTEDDFQSEEQLLTPPVNTDANQDETETEEDMQNPDNTWTQTPTEADTEAPITEEEPEVEQPEQDETDIEPISTTPTFFEPKNSEAGTATLSGSIRYDMPFSTFDQQSGRMTFIDAIVSTLSVDSSKVRVTDIREGSVIFDFEITVPADDQETLESYANRLEEEARDGGSLSVFDGAAILDFQRKVTVFAPVSEFTTVPKDDSLITVLIVIAAVIILGAMGWFVYKNKVAESDTKSVGKDPKYKLSSNKKSPERLDLESRGTASRTSIGEEINDKIKLFATSPPSDSSL